MLGKIIKILYWFIAALGAASLLLIVAYTFELVCAKDVEKTSGALADCKFLFKMTNPQISEDNFVSLEYFKDTPRSALGDGMAYIIIKTKNVDIDAIKNSKRWIKYKDALSLLIATLKLVVGHRAEKYACEGSYIPQRYTRSFNAALIPD